MNTFLFNHIIDKYHLEYLIKYITLLDDIKEFYDKDLQMNVVEITSNIKNQKTCKNCGSIDTHVKDKYIYKVRHCYAISSVVEVRYIVRRFTCKDCKSITIEDNILNHSGKYSPEFIHCLIHHLSIGQNDFKTAAHYFKVSKQTAQRLFIANYDHPKESLPEILGIDDKHFYSYTDKGKKKRMFFTVLYDIKNGRIVDLCYSTTQYELSNYIKLNWTKEERSKVKYIACDLAKVYNNIASDKGVFPAVISTCNDWFHVIQDVNKELKSEINKIIISLKREYEDNNLLKHKKRKAEMLEIYKSALLTNNKRKNSKKPISYTVKNLFPNGDYITGTVREWSDIEMIDYLLEGNENLEKLYRCKEALVNIRYTNYYKIVKDKYGKKSRSEYDKLVSVEAYKDLNNEAIPLLVDSKNKIFEEVAQMLVTNLDNISNSFIKYKIPAGQKRAGQYTFITNARTERMNKEIKRVLKLSPKALTNFESFSKLLFVKHFKDTFINLNNVEI